MTRADAIREVAAEHPGALWYSIADWVAYRGYKRPSRQAIESALAKSGERGRPTERAKCPTCDQRVDATHYVFPAVRDKRVDFQNMPRGGERGRPTERAKCPLCASRVEVDACTADERERFELLCATRGYRPIDIVRAGLRVCGDFESGEARAGEWARPTVANTSQTPRTKRTKRKGAKSKS